MVIEKKYGPESPLDYAFLRKKAIELIQKYAGESWTDYNYHDPGVTILECLCYALTDLAYRTDFKIEDILSSPTGIVDRVKNSFYTPQEILTTAPVTLKDYRRVLIDRVDELQNIWIEPVTSSYTRSNARGLYRVILQFNNDVAVRLNDDAQLEKELIEKVRRFLVGCRNMGEDFREFIVLKPQELEMNASVIIQRKSIAEEVLAKICYTAECYLSPIVKTYLPDELLAKGMSIEDIYAGPLLIKGVILESDLTERKEVIDPFEIIRSISEIEGVVHISRFAITWLGTPTSLEPFHFPFLDLDTKIPAIQLYHNNLPLVINEDVFRDHLHKLRDANRGSYISQLYKSSQQSVVKGAYKNLSEYVSIQHMFPAIYGIGREGVEESQPAPRKAKVRQLKAYLLFFEQIMANYLSQLSKVPELFSPLFTFEDDMYTYFTQPLYKVPHVRHLLNAFTERTKLEWIKFKSDENNKYVEALKDYTEQSHQFRKRKKRAIEHILSRFNIIVDAYPAILYERLYGRWGKNDKIDHELVFKARLLANVRAITCFRNTGFDYLDVHEMTEQMNGYENKLRLLLYIPSQPEGRIADMVLQYINVQLENSPEGEEAVQSDPMYTSFSFRKQNESLFLFGADRSNYRIEQTVAGDEFEVRFKDDKTGAWEMVAKDKNKANARRRIGDFINLLNKVSINSEGFYVVDHSLLAPHLALDVFGFELYDEAGNPMLKNKRWRSFKEREEDIDNMFNRVEQSNEKDARELVSMISEYCDILVPSEGDDAAELFINSLVSVIDLIKKDTPSRYPAFRYVVNRLDLTILPENFFASRLTVVLPSWPSRFQEKSFRDFAQRLFRSCTPAHVRLEFLWLSFSKMKAFEDVYYEWLPTLKEINRDVDRIAMNEDMISFLLDAPVPQK